MTMAMYSMITADSSQLGTDLRFRSASRAEPRLRRTAPIVRRCFNRYMSFLFPVYPIQCISTSRCHLYIWYPFSDSTYFPSSLSAFARRLTPTTKPKPLRPKIAIPPAAQRLTYSSPRITSSVSSQQCPPPHHKIAYTKSPHTCLSTA